MGLYDRGFGIGISSRKVSLMKTIKGILKLKLQRITGLSPQEFFNEFIRILDDVPEPIPDTRMMLQMWATILLEIEKGRFEISRKKLVDLLLKEIP